jgi:hypothetical protein
MWRVLLIAVVLGGCASVPQASRDSDAEAKQFITHPNSATLYVYRNEFPGADQSMDDSVLYVDNRLIGSTLAGTFFRVELRPGDHLLHGYGHDPGSLRISILSGEITFVSLNVVNGISRFRRVDPKSGKREILRCCALMENWAPGQRPLLR